MLHLWILVINVWKAPLSHLPLIDCCFAITVDTLNQSIRWVTVQEIFPTAPFTTEVRPRKTIASHILQSLQVHDLWSQMHVLSTSRKATLEMFRWARVWFSFTPLPFRVAALLLIHYLCPSAPVRYLFRETETDSLALSVFFLFHFPF